MARVNAEAGSRTDAVGAPEGRDARGWGERQLSPPLADILGPMHASGVKDASAAHSSGLVPRKSSLDARLPGWVADASLSKVLLRPYRLG